MITLFNPKAADQILKASLFWTKHTGKTANDFNVEFDRAREIVELNPNIGKPQDSKTYPNLRKYIIPAINYAIYYDYSEALQEILVCAVVSTKLKRAPKL